jgi:hypothetical protein
MEADLTSLITKRKTLLKRLSRFCRGYGIKEPNIRFTLTDAPKELESNLTILALLNTDRDITDADRRKLRSFVMDLNASLSGLVELVG